MLKKLKLNDSTTTYKILYGFIELFSFSFFGFSIWGTDLDYYDIEWFVLEMNRNHSVIFETEPKYCILDSC